MRPSLCNRTPPSPSDDLAFWCLWLLHHDAHRPRVAGLLSRAVDARALRDLAAVQVVTAKASLAWIKNADARRRATALGELVVSKTELAGTGAVVGRRRLQARRLTDLYLAHPDMIRARAQMRGREHLDAVLDSGRGAVLATLHGDPMWINIQVISAVSPLSILVGPWFFNEGLGVGGPAHRRAIEAVGSEVIGVGEWNATFADRLRAGRLCPVTLDIPGEREVALAGKRALVKPGCAALSRLTGAYVLPVSGYFEGTRPIVEFGVPLDPVDHPVPRKFIRAIAASLDEPLRRHPELWSPHTSELWPDDVGPYAWAFDG